MGVGTQGTFDFQTFHGAPAYLRGISNGRRVALLKGLEVTHLLKPPARRNGIQTRQSWRMTFGNVLNLGCNLN